MFLSCLVGTPVDSSGTRAVDLTRSRRRAINYIASPGIIPGRTDKSIWNFSVLVH